MIDQMLPDDAVPMTAFDADSTIHFQSKMKNAPVWFCSFVASNTREKNVSARTGAYERRMATAHETVRRRQMDI